MNRAVFSTLALAVVGACFLVLPVRAQGLSGAIFTTTVNGSEVNANQYAAKEDVYLDGGPGPGAPQTAAGLPDGTYVFQVTDPSGKTLLSSDPVRCRQFTVTNGIITGVVTQADNCQHATGSDIDHGATTVQLIPYDDTPNPGGVYKVWVTMVEDYACFPDLSRVDCAAGGKHGFVPANSKTDNFKVKSVPIREIDGFFFDSTDQHLSGMQMTWIDTLGASNQKSSYYVSFWDVIEAHVEAVEDGTHQIVVTNQSGCTVGDIYLREYTYTSGSLTYVGYGPQTVPVKIAGNHYQNHFVEVHCQ